MELPTIICLIGTSRSGSTLLQHVLSAHEGVAAVGEVRRLPELLARGAKCACGQALKKCSAWAGPVAETRTRYEQTSDHLSTFGRGFRIVSNLGALSIRSPALAMRAERSEATYLARIAKSLSGELASDILVDSSKDIEQFLRLALVRELPLVPVHLVRDPRGVVWSAKRRVGTSPDLMASHWLRLNRAVTWLRRITPHYAWQVVRYEDLCEDPHGIASKILSAAGQPTPRPKTGPTISHAIGGSPGFQVGDIDEIKVDEQWRQEFVGPALSRVNARTNRLAKAFGYAD